jgi:hypothetical protein
MNDENVGGKAKEMNGQIRLLLQRRESSEADLKNLKTQRQKLADNHIDHFLPLETTYLDQQIKAQRAEAGP